MHWSSESDGDSKDCKLDLEGDRDIEGAYFVSESGGCIFFNTNRVSSECLQPAGEATGFSVSYNCTAVKLRSTTMRVKVGK